MREDRDATVTWITAGWRATMLKYERSRTLAVRDILAAAAAVGSAQGLSGGRAAEDRDGP